MTKNEKRRLKTKQQITEVLNIIHNKNDFWFDSIIDYHRLLMVQTSIQLLKILKKAKIKRKIIMQRRCLSWA